MSLSDKYGPNNKETAVYSRMEIPGIEVDYNFPEEDFESFDLGSLVEYLSKLDPKEIFNCGICNAHSWRGDYYQLAFEPCRNVNTEKILRLAQSCIGVEFQGYKGGFYKMHESSDVYISYVGESYDIRLNKPTMEALRTYSD